MAVTLPPILDQVKGRLPFLLQVQNADDLINAKLAEALAELQAQSGKDNVDVWEENTYTPAQKVFFAAYTGLKILMYRITATVSGDGTEGNTGTGNKLVVEATVDVLTTKFDIINASDKDLGIKTTDLITNFQKEVCSLANTVGWSLPFCGTSTPQIPFAFYELEL